MKLEAASIPHDFWIHDSSFTLNDKQRDSSLLTERQYRQFTWKREEKMSAFPVPSETKYPAADTQILQQQKHVCVCEWMFPRNNVDPRKKKKKGGIEFTPKCQTWLFWVNICLC